MKNHNVRERKPDLDSYVLRTSPSTSPEHKVQLENHAYKPKAYAASGPSGPFEAHKVIGPFEAHKVIPSGGHTLGSHTLGRTL